MAYDERLAARTRALLDPKHEVTERKMFGGLAFLLHGNMAVVVTGAGGLMLRVEHDEGDVLVAGGEAALVEMKGRPLRGWLLVDSERLADDHELESWVNRAVHYTQTLPTKTKR